MGLMFPGVGGNQMQAIMAGPGQMNTGSAFPQGNPNMGGGFMGGGGQNW